ncbi:MAG: hydroxyacylglutathione hydrolase [Chromatiales bacterium]
MLTVTPLRALKDNYIWLMHGAATGAAVVVDPSEAAPVVAALTQHDLDLVAIIVTHHHWDHVGGIEELVSRYRVRVHGPATESIPCRTHGVTDGDVLSVPELGLRLLPMAVPGHTLGAIAYHGEAILFSGDTLFTAGCGRLFEGTAAQMHQSLSRLGALPDETLLYCGHEYTLANLSFAVAVEPDNDAAVRRLRETEEIYRRGQPAVPAPLALEKQTNPFLRCGLPSVHAAAERYCGRELSGPAAVFAAIREWKNRF